MNPPIGMHERDTASPVAISDAQLEEVARLSADKATRKVFAILGVDLDKPESVESFREDLRFGRRLRKAADHGFLAIVGAVAIGLVAVTLLGIGARLRELIH
ncbi:hypothetical protein P3G55_23170 [Leptospira sp. 96542]|nr:hypothetical protein [Leptospira sp. 96542]